MTGIQFDILSCRLASMKQHFEAEHNRRGFLYVASDDLSNLIARMGAMAEMAAAIEQALVQERVSSSEYFYKLIKHQRTVATILFLMQADAADSNVIPFRPRSQTAPQHPTGGDAA